jgi:hypothetical protein
MPETFYLRERRHLVAIAQDILSDKVDIIIGVRRLVSVWAGLEEKDNKFFLPIIGVESETDALPTEEERSLWVPEAFVRKRREADRYLDKVRAIVFEICEEIVGRYG